MREPPMLSEAEWALLIELLERERHELPPEIHHTRTSTLRDELRKRLAAVERLLARLADPGGVRDEEVPPTGQP